MDDLKREHFEERLSPSQPRPVMLKPNVRPAPDQRRITDSMVYVMDQMPPPGLLD